MSNKQRILGVILVIAFIGITFYMVPKQIFFVTIIVYLAVMIICLVNKLKKQIKKQKIVKEGRE